MSQTIKLEPCPGQAADLFGKFRQEIRNTQALVK